MFGSAPSAPPPALAGLLFPDLHRTSLEQLAVKAENHSVELLPRFDKYRASFVDVHGDAFLNTLAPEETVAELLNSAADVSTFVALLQALLQCRFARLKQLENVAPQAAEMPDAHDLERLAAASATPETTAEPAKATRDGRDST